MTVTNEISSLSATFSKRAEPPKQHIEEAESFLDRLQKAGSVVSDQDRSHGEKILNTLTEQTALYEFHASVLAGQTLSLGDLDRHLEQIQSGIDHAERTKARLTSVLSLGMASI